jgi:hypothetical protein
MISSSQRGFIFLDDAGIDEATKQALELPGVFAQAKVSALKSLGYHVREEMWRAGTLGTSDLGWPHLNPRTGVFSSHRGAIKRGNVKNWRSVWRGKKGSKRRGREYWSESPGGKMSTRENPMGRLVNAIRYQMEGDRVTIGFVKQSSHLRRLAFQLAAGFSTRVTPKMRRFFWAMGFPLKKSTTVLKTPARKWAEPVAEKNRKQFTQVFREKFWAAYDRYQDRGVRAA